ncbi:HEAT repeat domain-containing protein [Chitinophaga rhizophila]|uniref:HEAT repeat domain-containing protein n=1 Tax=Chitinophaga rhizophila TaxID=2866212 RepID=A0ABS7G5Y3_9BACT|nr:HEAT repeat domain-containing protein [Chitinophaga rhizophila]MBW8682881.1 HEAT repeat domain-containing protein [Chitinophaga rhizophila]
MSRNDWSNDKLFDRLLGNKSSRTYWDNVRELCRRPDKDVYKRCVALTKSALPQERRAGIDILSQLGGEERPFEKETLALYLRILPKENDQKVLESLLHAIGHNNKGLDNEGIGKLLPLTAHRYTGVRFALTVAIKGIDKPAAIDILIALSADKDIDIRNWATYSLGAVITRNNKVIREALYARIHDQDEDTRLEAIAGLAIRKDPRVRELIIKELQTGEAGTLLFEAMTALGDPALLPALKQLHKASVKAAGIHPEWLAKLAETIKALSATNN